MASFAVPMEVAPLITEPSAFQDLMGQLSDEPCIALDTEASSFHRFHERIGLIRLSNRKKTWLLDHSPWTMWGARHHPRF